MAHDRQEKEVSKLKIKQSIVVEGKKDTVAVQRACHAHTIETGGSAIHDGVFERIRLARDVCGVIVLTDPDHAGERLRRCIDQRVPGCEHAFLSRDVAMKAGCIGVEYARPEAIVQALLHVRTVCEETSEQTDVTMEALWEWSMVGAKEAALKRAYVGERLAIGRANVKTFLARCRQFQIRRAEIEHILIGWGGRGIDV